MKIGETKKILILITMCSLAWSQTAHAHDFWLQPDTFRLDGASTLPVTVEIGHGADRNSWEVPLHRVVRFNAHHRDGTSDLQPALHRLGGNAVLLPALESAGINLLTLDTTHAFSELDGATFTEYLNNEGLAPAITQREITRSQDQPGRELYSRRSKALVQVAEPQPGDDKIATAVIGQTLEIIPLANPYTLADKAEFPVEIRHQGQPLQGALVKLRQLDEGEEEVFAEQTTDADGKTSFTFPHAGHWLMAVVWTRPLPGNPDAEWDTTFSSLSFGWPETEQ